MADVSIGATLASISQSSQAPSFEFTFNKMQNTIIRRLNEEVEAVQERGAVNRHRVTDLQRKGRQLIDQLPIIQDYRVGNLLNVGQFQALTIEVEAAISALGADDTVTAAEVTAFETARDALVERIDRTYIYVHPDIVDGKVVQDLKDDLDTFKAFTAVTGTLSGDNAALVSDLNTLLNRSATALSTTQNTVTTALDFEQNINTKLAGIEADITELTTLDIARKEAEIDDLRVDAANLLSAISLSFEVNNQFAQDLTDRLKPIAPPAGSILNIFT